MNSRRQELLSRLKTTLAIVSQATGFDNERAGGEGRSAEPQWTLGRDPRLRRNEPNPEAPGGSEPGTSSASRAVTSSARSSSGMFQKCDEMQDEDEFLYGSTSPAHSSRQQVAAADSGPEKKSDDHHDRDMRLQWVTPRQEREEGPWWARTSASHQASFSDPSQAVGQQADDPRRSRNAEPAAIGQQSVVGPRLDQSQWMQPSSSKVDDGTWGGASSSALRYSDVDRQQSMGRGPEVAPANVGLQPENMAGRLQGINTGMLEGILKLVAAGTNKSAAAQSQQQQPLQQQQPQQLPMQQHLQQPLMQQRPQQQQLLQQQPQQQPFQQPQQLPFESQHPYGTGYPPQNVYGQFPDQRGIYISPGVPHHVASEAAVYAPPIQIPQAAYGYSQPPLPPQQRQGADANPLFSQLATAFLDSRMPSVSSQPVTDPARGLTGLLEQVGARNPPASYDRPAVASTESHQFPPSRLDERPSALPPAATAAEKPLTRTPDPYPVVYDAPGPAVPTLADTPTPVEPDEAKGGLAKGDVDKDNDTLKRLLNMIGCNSNVTSLMQELLKKDEQDKKQQTPAQPDSTAVTPAAQPLPEPEKKETYSIKTSTPSVPQTQPEPAGSSSTMPETEPEHDEKPKPSLTPEPTSGSENGETASNIRVLSSLSRLQRNYGSPDKDAAENSSKNHSSVVKDDEWERSTEEFLRRLQSKPGVPAKSQKEREKSRSTSRDKTPKNSQTTTPTESKTSAAKQTRSEATKSKDEDTKVKDTRDTEVQSAENDNERAYLLSGKREIEDALELLQKELGNLRANKKRLLESPSDAQRNAELEKSIENEQNLTDHMSQLKKSMSELNKHLEQLEKLSSVKV